MMIWNLYFKIKNMMITNSNGAILQRALLSKIKFPANHSFHVH